jgi:translation initiation factor IF-3
VGETDEIGFSPVVDRVDIHDVQATILHLLGLDHTRLTFRFQGRDFRLTDIGGRVIRKLLA